MGLHLDLSDQIWKQFVKVSQVNKNLNNGDTVTMKGVIAIKDIPQHVRIGHYVGRLSNKIYDNYAIRVQTEKFSGKISPFDPEIGKFYPEMEGHFSALINEASENDDGPNVIMVNNHVLGCVDFVTLKNIKAGEELTTFYGFSYYRNYSIIGWMDKMIKDGAHLLKDWGEIKSDGFHLPFVKVDTVVNYRSLIDLCTEIK